MTELQAFKLGFLDRANGSDMGLTWDDDQDLNEAYDRGRNLADELLG